MSKLFKIFSSWVNPLSERDRYLSGASDLAELEFRQKSWEKHERNNYRWLQNQ